jgi:hypothetical protein
MSVGANIAVIATGAILSFAVHAHTPGIDIAVIGAVVMAVGVAALVMQLASLARQRELTALGARSAGSPVVVRPSVDDDRFDQNGGF